jgi:hypothetical protein
MEVAYDQRRVHTCMKIVRYNCFIKLIYNNWNQTKDRDNELV